MGTCAWSALPWWQSWKTQQSGVIGCRKWSKAPWGETYSWEYCFSKNFPFRYTEKKTGQDCCMIDMSRPNNLSLELHAFSSIKSAEPSWLITPHSSERKSYWIVFIKMTDMTINWKAVLKRLHAPPWQSCRTQDIIQQYINSGVETQ